MISLTSVFNKYYTDKLKQYQFQKLRGMSCFGRIINNEIFQYIIPINRKSLKKGKKAFTVVSGIFTVYSSSLSKDTFENWGNFFTDFEFIDLSINNKYDELCQLYYDDNNIQEVVEFSFNKFEKIMLPYMNKIRTLDDYILYCKEMKIALLKNADKMWNDSILLLKVNNHDDFMDVFNEICNKLIKQFNNNPNDPNYMKTKSVYYDAIIVNIAMARDKVYNNPELYEKAMKELQCRKKINIQILQSYGFHIN
ncbi:MAG: hypothetical protein SOT80_11005 [Candidatus Pseudoruminococcus sp.]|nr:hypothetical protein [Ruminococcus sp.]MDY2783906.1 hypothetical protein [Candidatus Pseudoruminococcus sp.]